MGGGSDAIGIVQSSSINASQGNSSISFSNFGYGTAKRVFYTQTPPDDSDNPWGTPAAPSIVVTTVFAPGGGQNFTGTISVGNQTIKETRPINTSARYFIRALE